MRLGVDGGCWSNVRGYGRYTRELLRALSGLIGGGHLESVRLYVDRQSAESCEFPANVQLVVAETREAASRAARHDGRRSLGDLWAYRSAVRREPPDVLFFPSVYSYFPPPAGIPVVVTVHDAIAESFPYLVFPRRRQRVLWNLKVRMALRRARRVLTVSSFARGEIARQHGLDPAVVDVVPEAPAPVFAPPRPGPDPAVLARHGVVPGRPFFLYVGGLAPHKNLAALIDALAALAGGRPELSLLLVGQQARDTFLSEGPRLRARIAGLPQGMVRLLDFVPDAELVHLYAAAVATVLPSFNEGFGLPVFEAAACGGATIATQASAAPEFLRDGALIIDPARPSELLHAMRRLLDDPDLRAARAAAGLRRARELSWDASALALLDVLAGLTAGRRSSGNTIHSAPLALRA